MEESTQGKRRAVLELANEMGVIFENLLVFRLMWPDLKKITEMEQEMKSHNFCLTSVSRGFTLKRI